MFATNPFSPPGAVVGDIEPSVTAGRYSQPKVWSWRGRIGRLRYMGHLVLGAALTFVLFLITTTLAMAFRIPMDWLPALGYAISVPMLILSMLSHIQRAHDMSWSGWTSLLVFIPLVGLVWLLKSGSAGVNRFGPPSPPNTLLVKIGAVLCGLLMAALLGTMALTWHQADGMPEGPGVPAPSP